MTFNAEHRAEQDSRRDTQEYKVKAIARKVPTGTVRCQPHAKYCKFSPGLNALLDIDTAQPLSQSLFTTPVLTQDNYASLLHHSRPNPGRLFLASSSFPS